MANPQDTLRSPFDNVFHYLPQGHDKALKQAFYNTAATLFVVAVCCGGVAVYYILEHFLGPLLWAVLFGSFLFPFKSTLTGAVRAWLLCLRESHTPLLVGTALFPLQILDRASTEFGTQVWRNLYLLLGGCAALPIVCLIFSFWPIGDIFMFFYVSFMAIYNALGYFNAAWVWSVVVAYVLALYFLWSPSTRTLLSVLAVPVWAVLLLYLTSIAGPLRVPLVIALVIMVIFGAVAGCQRTNQEEDGGAVDGCDEEEEEEPSRIKAFLLGLLGRRSLPETSEAPNEAPINAEDQADNVQDVHAPVEPETVERSLSDLCFLALLWAIVLTQLWRHLWVLQLLPLFIACLFIKKIGIQLGSWKLLQDKFECVATKLKQSLCSEGRSELLMPKPIQGLANLVLKGDRKIVGSLEASMDQFMSILIILILMIGMVLMSFFIVIQVQKESVHLVTVSSNVLNKTEVSNWLPANEDMSKAVDSMVENAYVYGREWIVSQLHGMLSGDAESKEQMQRQVLHLWDELYEKWFVRNNTMQLSRPPKELTRQMSLIDLTEVNSVWDLLDKVQGFNLDFVGFAKEHIGIFMSVMESVWLVLKGNVTLALNVVMSSLSLVLGGGTALLNLLLQLVVFLTALFYLLAASGDQYLPAAWFASLTPSEAGSEGNKFGRAVEEAISSVLLASLKMALFYGLYTWWTHTLFDVQIVFIPSALAATFAAVPFLGTYIAAIPGFIELYIVNGQKIEAVLFMLLHLLPSSIVDSAIYSDIKGGHPYMTGLAIAGGIYWLGLEGAIIGPILLCCLVVAVKMYSTMLQPSPPTPTPARTRRQRGMTDKRVTFSLQRGFSSPDCID